MLFSLRNISGVYLALAVEVFLWAVVPLVFLSFYIFKFGAPASVFFPHFLVVGCFWIGFFGLRLVNWRYRGEVGYFRRALGAVLLIFPPLFFMFWYFAIVLGLISWGRMTTWPLLEVYLGQMIFLLEVIGVPFFFIGIVFFVSFLFLFFIFRFLPMIDVARFASKRLTVSGVLGVSISSVLVLGSVFFYLPGLAYDHPAEPISGGFFPSRSPTLQSHALSNHSELILAENGERISYKPLSEFERRNIVLIVGDALRSDHMGVYGYARQTTPHLEASVGLHQTFIASQARSVCAESFCGLAALASSRPLHLLVSNPMTLHEVLRSHGYKVKMILSGDHTNFYGLKEWYGNLDGYFDGTHQSKHYVNDDQLLVDHVSGLPENSGDPVMFQFHLMSTHGLGKRHASNEFFVPFSNYYKWPSGNPRIAPSLGEANKAVNYYDNGMLQFDSVVNSILVALELKGYLDNALVVIVGDHGEMLGESEGFGHQHGVSEEVLQIPLIVQRRGYRGEGFANRSIVSQIDVAPTILHELGVEIPSVWRGVALQAPDMARRIDFQQAPWVGFYDVGRYERPLKYWVNTSSGEEFFSELGALGGDIFRGPGHLDSSILKEWRREAIGNTVFGQSLE